MTWRQWLDTLFLSAGSLKSPPWKRRPPNPTHDKPTSSGTGGADPGPRILRWVHQPRDSPETKQRRYMARESEHGAHGRRILWGEHSLLEWACPVALPFTPLGAAPRCPDHRGTAACCLLQRWWRVAPLQRPALLLCENGSQNVTGWRDSAGERPAPPLFGGRATRSHRMTG